MTNRYIYKLYFKNGCTYVGKHTQKRENDGYITSSSYYKKHKDLLERREILIEHLPDIDTLDIMESLCIMQDICSNDLNVNRNRGAWLDPSKFDRGFKGPANGMYGKHMSDFCSKEKLEEMAKKCSETRKRRYKERVESGEITPMMRRAIRAEASKKRTEINRIIRKAHKDHEKYLKSLPKKWYYNKVTLKETYWYESPGDDWELGRCPHNLWTDEKKKSYAEKHSKSFTGWFDRLPKEKQDEFRKKASEYNKEKIWLTNGKENIFARQGMDIPEGFYLGFSFVKTDKYINSRKGRRNG